MAINFSLDLGRESRCRFRNVNRLRLRLNLYQLLTHESYLSISPNTMSSEPMIATMSATISPSDICGSADRFTKLGPRKCTRDGFGPPSDFTYTPSSPLEASMG